MDTLTPNYQVQLPTKVAATVISLHPVPSQQRVLALASSNDFSLIHVCQPPTVSTQVETCKVFKCHSSTLVQYDDR